MNASAPLPPCSILLLAGGRGQRMGGRDKGLIEWQGEPMIQHLHRLTRPLTDDLIISCNRNLERYAAYADRLVQDSDTDFNGPLAGILAALPQAQHDALLVLPCDVPLIDKSLLDALRQLADRHPDNPVMVREGEHWQPLLCIIPTATLRRWKPHGRQASAAHGGRWHPCIQWPCNWTPETRDWPT